MNNYIAFFTKFQRSKEKARKILFPFSKRDFLKVNLVSKAGRKLNGVPRSSNTLAIIVSGAQREHVIASTHLPRLGLGHGLGHGPRLLTIQENKPKLPLPGSIPGLNKALLLLGRHVFRFGDNAPRLILNEVALGKSTRCFERSPMPNLGAGPNQHFETFSFNNVFAVGAFSETSHYKIT